MQSNENPEEGEKNDQTSDTN